LNNFFKNKTKKYSTISIAVGFFIPFFNNSFYLYLTSFALMTIGISYVINKEILIKNKYTIILYALLSFLLLLPSVFFHGYITSLETKKNEKIVSDNIEKRNRKNADLIEIQLKDIVVKNDPLMVARLCETVKTDLLSENILSKCSEAHALSVNLLLKQNKVIEARKSFNLSLKESPLSNHAKKYESNLLSAEKRLAEQKIKEKKKKDIEDKNNKLELEKIARMAYGKVIREYYLDSGINIKVRVSGKNNDKLTLTYPLFTEVWSHQFQKSGNLQSIRELGFKRVDMTDDYDFHIYWDL